MMWRAAKNREGGERTKREMGEERTRERAKEERWWERRDKGTAKQVPKGEWIREARSRNKSTSVDGVPSLSDRLSTNLLITTQ